MHWSFCSFIEWGVINPTFLCKHLQCLNCFFNYNGFVDLFIPSDSGNFSPVQICDNMLSFWVEANVGYFYRLFFSVLPLGIRLSRGGWLRLHYPVSPATYMWLSHASNDIWYGPYYVQWFKVRYNCLFCRDWWNCWPPLLKLTTL